jgi:hypothetical protein
MNKKALNMKKYCIIVALLFVAIALKAQNYNSSNSLARVALVYYSQDEKGFFQKKENINLQEVSQVVSSYGYNKKSHELYLETERANCIVTVNDDLHKILKKSKSIPQMKDNELTAKSIEISKILEERFSRLNQAREKHINDSIQKAREDSIKKAREDSIRMVKLAKQKDDYRRAHNWRWVPISKTRLSCSLCDRTVYSEDSLLCIAFKNDTLYHITSEDIGLGESYLKLHPMYVPSSLKSKEKFKYHFEVYGDSLMSNALESINTPELFNSIGAYDALQRVRAKAPNGFFEDWGWNNEYGSVTFSFKYTNTNKNTIKYIDVYWVVTNDVGDVRKSGSFKGTGPLAEWETASWNWDHSMYYVAGDATEMNITKVIITYMNGSKVTIPKNKLWFN